LRCLRFPVIPQALDLLLGKADQQSHFLKQI
jgi:hypothetical protein